MEGISPPPHARVVYVVTTAEGVAEAGHHAHKAQSFIIAMTPAAAAALAATDAAGAQRRLFLPPAYAHCWQEFPSDPSLWVWCDTEHAWETVRAHRPHATRWIATCPTFPAAPLRVDAETGRFTWCLAHGGQLRAWGPLY